MFLIIIQMDIELGKRGEGGGGKGRDQVTVWRFLDFRDFVRGINSMKFYKIHNFM